MEIKLLLIVIQSILIIAAVAVVRSLSAKHQNQLFALQDEIDTLQNEKISYMMQNERLNTLLNERGSILESQKSVMYDLTHDITTKLLEIHKQETAESRQISEQNIRQNTFAFTQELQNIKEFVAILFEQVKTAKKSYDDIHRAIVSPVGFLNLSEITLENILRNCGLHEGLDFVLQHTSNSNGTVIRPDCLVFLPNDDVFVIDAKSSKYLLSIDEENGDEKLYKSVLLHLKSLQSKEYARDIKIEFVNKHGRKVARILTLMFFPSESIIERIMKIDNEILQKAWNNDIYIVGPSGLMSMLSLVRLQIAECKRAENYDKITQEISVFIDNLGGVFENVTRVSNSIATLVGAYDKFALSFNKHIFHKVNSLQTLGVEVKYRFTPFPRYQLVREFSESTSPVTNEEIVITSH